MNNVTQRIVEFNAGRLPELVQVKYKTMAQNAFSFFRGTCHLYYQDLLPANAMPPAPLTWCCGDLHIENFGSYKGDNRLVYFDVNDFDEGLLAPATWEVSRMLTSIFVAFDSLKIKSGEAERMAALFLKTYSATLKSGKSVSIEPRTAKGIVCSFLEAEAQRKIKDLLAKRTETRGGKLILSMKHPRHWELEKGLKVQLMDHITHWINNSSEGPYNYKVTDAVFRVAGTGSLGVKRYVFLLHNTKKKGKYLLLDMKEALTPSALPYNHIQQPHWDTEAERVLAIQQRMQNVLPALLSTTIFKDASYILQEMQPTEDKIDFNIVKNRYRDIYQVIDDMATLTASAQLRSSGRQGSAVADELLAFGHNSHWHDALLTYAKSYMAQVKKDYKAFAVDYKKTLSKQSDKRKRNNLVSLAASI
jgi:uncharacterized protein (DUF2252 family)